MVFFFFLSATGHFITNTTYKLNNYQISEPMPNPVPGPEEADKLPTLEKFTPGAGAGGGGGAADHDEVREHVCRRK